MSIKTFEDVAVEVIDLDVQSEASLHHNLYGDKPFLYRPEDFAYSYYSTLFITGRCIYPQKMKDDTFIFRIIGDELYRGRLSAVLDDFHKRDEYGSRIYKKYRGEDYPVMSPPPKGVGTYEKVRGESKWQANLWMGKDFVRNIMTMITVKEQLYIYMNKYTDKRTHWISEFSVTSKNPLDELI
tara:strand:- start:1026 stop:1574 length:549 start_codon:yes stop_codon:yes gene_type:complete